MRQVSSAIQDLDNQIEEQKLKIQNTANTSLRVSLCGFLVCIQATSKSGSVELCRVCLHGRLFCPLLSFCTQSYILSLLKQKVKVGLEYAAWASNAGCGVIVKNLLQSSAK